MLNLDTHILLHAFSNQLTDSEKKKIESKKIFISDIVQWEIAKLTQLGKIQLDWNIEFQEAMRQIQTIPISWEIAKQTMKLDFSSDPADEIIAATSIVTGIPLLTRDKKILKSKIVPFA